MTFLQHYRDLFAYDRWANRRTLDSIRAFGEEGDPDVLRLLAHILGASRVWLTRMEEGDYSALETWPALDFDACAVTLEMLYERWSRYLEDLTEERLDDMMAYRNTKGVAFENSIRDTMNQVINHGTYHRGQIATIVRQKGKTPAVTDHIVWVRAGRGEQG